METQRLAVLLFRVPPNAEVTPWFHGAVNPVRPGVYEREICAYEGGYARWTGSVWMAGSYFRGDSFLYESQSRRQEVPWRGLTCEAFSQIQRDAVVKDALRESVRAMDGWRDICDPDAVSGVRERLRRALGVTVGAVTTAEYLSEYYPIGANTAGSR